MEASAVLTLGLGVSSPWRLVDQHLDRQKSPHVLEIQVEADRGAAFPCPDCGKPCKAHDFKEFTWRHLNFFQHHCMITARVARTNCPEHGVKRGKVPWARDGSGFTLLFEQAAMTLVREMPALAAARIIGISDTRLWRIVAHYVAKGLKGLDLSGLTVVALDETSAKKGHNYVTVFIDADRKKDPVIFATPGKGKATVEVFRAFLEAHGGKPGRIVEVVCDMSPAFLAAVAKEFPDAEVTLDWFHLVQLFTKAVDTVRKAEHKQVRLPAAIRWASSSHFGMNHRATWSLRALPAPAKGHRPLDPACFLGKWGQGACPLRAWAAPNSVIVGQNENCCRRRSLHGAP